MENNVDKKPLDIWETAILLEREKNDLHPFLLATIPYVENKDTALILGDASQVNSRYLGEEAGFKEIDNVDGSPLVLDGYYASEKMKPFNTYFGGFSYPENKYDLVYGKSLSFAKKDFVPEILTRIAKSLRHGGIFSSIWNLEKNTNVPPQGIWEKEVIEKLLIATGLTIIKSETTDEPRKALSGKDGFTHSLRVIMKKE